MEGNKAESNQGFFKTLEQNRDFLSNPITIILSSSAVFFATQLLGGFLALPVIISVRDKNTQLLAIILGSSIVLCAVLILFKKATKFSFSSIGLTVPKSKHFIQVIPAALLYFLVSASFTLLAIRFIPGFNSNQAQEVGFTKETAGWQMIAAFFSLVVLTPIFEETVFRGLLFKRLRSRLGFKSSIIIASLVFAVAHMQWNVSVDTFALSLTLCWLVEKSGSVVPGIALHSLKNGIAFVLLFVVK